MSSQSNRPFFPAATRAISEAKQLNCLPEMIIIQSMLATASAPFSTPESSKPFIHPSSDHLTLLNVFRAYKYYLESPTGVSQIEKRRRRARVWCSERGLKAEFLENAVKWAIGGFQMYGLAPSLGASGEKNSENIRLALARAAFPTRIAKYSYESQRYHVLINPQLKALSQNHLRRDLVVPFVIFENVTKSLKRSAKLKNTEYNMSTVTVIEECFLELMPKFAEYNRRLMFPRNLGRADQENTAPEHPTEWENHLPLPETFYASAFRRDLISVAAKHKLAISYDDDNHSLVIKADSSLDLDTGTTALTNLLTTNFPSFPTHVPLFHPKHNHSTSPTLQSVDDLDRILFTTTKIESTLVPTRRTYVDIRVEDVEFPNIHILKELCGGEISHIDGKSGMFRARVYNVKRAEALMRMEDWMLKGKVVRFRLAVESLTF